MAKRHNIAITVIVNNNSGFGQCLVPVERVYGDRPGNPRDLTCFGPTNFARIAEDFGCRGIRVENPGEIGAAIDTALKSDRPVVVDVATDPRPRAPEEVKALYRRHARGNTLFRNRGDGTFEDVTVETGAEMGRWAWS